MLLRFIKSFFGQEQEDSIVEDDMKYLIVGLGNIGGEYDNTRHNIGFDVLDEIAEKCGASFKLDTLAHVAMAKFKGRSLVLIKPTTYMNRSGKSVQYWMTKHKIPKDRVLVVLDDLNLKFGTLRLRGKGSDGGHNGLKDINAHLQGQDYARLRFGIGSDFHKGQQVNFVLGKWSSEEQNLLSKLVPHAASGCLSFASIGLKFTMEKYNKPLKLD